jgi:hypothetical protein
LIACLNVSSVHHLRCLLPMLRLRLTLMTLLTVIASLAAAALVLLPQLHLPAALLLHQLLLRLTRSSQLVVDDRPAAAVRGEGAAAVAAARLTRRRGI